MKAQHMPVPLCQRSSRHNRYLLGRLWRLVMFSRTSVREIEECRRFNFGRIWTMPKIHGQFALEWSSEAEFSKTKTNVHRQKTCVASNFRFFHYYPKQGVWEGGREFPFRKQSCFLVVAPVKRALFFFFLWFTSTFKGVTSRWKCWKRKQGH